MRTQTREQGQGQGLGLKDHMAQSFQLLDKLIFLPGYMVHSGGLFSSFTFGKIS
jgi:hypothetical protein